MEEEDEETKREREFKERRESKLKVAEWMDKKRREANGDAQRLVLYWHWLTPCRWLAACDVYVCVYVLSQGLHVHTCMHPHRRRLCREHVDAETCCPLLHPLAPHPL